MKSKWISIELVERKAKTNVWWVFDKKNNDLLGKIYWKGGWRQYVFEPFEGFIFSWDCLKTISDFIHKEMKKRKR